MATKKGYNPKKSTLDELFDEDTGGKSTPVIPKVLTDDAVEQARKAQDNPVA